ncbi:MULTISPECIES: alkene reductase [Stutzerimonas]|uniref:Alkene reductase n=1 Tax=Stutzerimonas azotifigens TaxID=291995 RepID=A0ABR5Z1A4_9GAMM|nr:MULTISPECIES: alkene reductase [Stutzerimonas]MBA1273960.1 alkene reductase [Stutzerimonas azotifigens]
MPILFETFNLSGLTLKNRVVMAPLTRSRAPNDVADERIALYYTQRATAGLIISEGTPISREGQGYLFNAEQIAGWRLTTDSVHAVGGKMFAQIWHVGRVSHPSIQSEGKLPVSATTKQAVGATAFGYDANGTPALLEPPAPRQLTTEEVARIVGEFAQAAENAIQAGFDGVEIHGANGYLFEQFMNPLVNDRNDQYSAGLMEDRLRFTLEVIDAVVSRVGAHRVGIRLSPYGQLFDMPLYEEVDETYSVLAAEIRRRQLAYIHIMDQSGFPPPGAEVGGNDQKAAFINLLSRMKSELPDTAVILAGGMNRARAEQLINDGVIDLAAFGTPYISNPDLVERLKHKLPLAEAKRETFYAGGAQGYIDYSPYQG